ncbi:hypothetical protein [Nocardia wallacei]|nr:hypothetical protein [Nocardia wallacei]
MFPGGMLEIRDYGDSESDGNPGVYLELSGPDPDEDSDQPGLEAL